MEDLIKKILPKTYYAGLDSEARLTMFVEAWRRLIKINQELEQKIDSFLLEAKVKPVDYGTCKNCIFNLETDENSLVSECQLTIDEFTGIGLQFSRDFGCNQWQSKPSV